MKLLFLVITLFSFVAGGCYDDNSTPASTEFNNSHTCSIAQLQKFCENGCYNITSDIICVGRVTSSDREGNFYRSIVIEDDSGGLEIKISAKAKKSEIILTVSANGIGIPADKIKTLFKPFAQVENIMTRSHQGSGLGLALVKRLMEVHKGTVKLESTAGKGTTITCTFPQKQLPSKKESHEQK